MSPASGVLSDHFGVTGSPDIVVAVNCTVCPGVPSSTVRVGPWGATWIESVGPPPPDPVKSIPPSPPLPCAVDVSPPPEFPLPVSLVAPHDHPKAPAVIRVKEA